VVFAQYILLYASRLSRITGYSDPLFDDPSSEQYTYIAPAGDSVSADYT